MNHVLPTSRVVGMIRLFLAVLGLIYWAQGCSLVVRGPLIVVTFLVAEHGSRSCGLSSCDAWI